MRLFIIGIAITLVTSIVAFVLSFQACSSIAQPTNTDTIDVIEIEDTGDDIIDDTKPTDKEINESTNKYDKVEMIVFDIDGKVVHYQIVDNI